MRTVLTYLLISVNNLFNGIFYVLSFSDSVEVYEEINEKDNKPTA